MTHEKKKLAERNVCRHLKAKMNIDIMCVCEKNLVNYGWFKLANVIEFEYLYEYGPTKVENKLERREDMSYSRYFC